MQTAPEARGRSREPINSVPRQGQLLLSRLSRQKSSYFWRAVPCPTNPPLVPERQSSRRKVDLKKFEPSPFPWQGTVLPITPQGHARSLCQRDLLMRFVAKICQPQVSFRERHMLSALVKMQTAQESRGRSRPHGKSAPRQGINHTIDATRDKLEFRNTLHQPRSAIKLQLTAENANGLRNFGDRLRQQISSSLPRQRYHHRSHSRATLGKSASAAPCLVR